MRRVLGTVRVVVQYGYLGMVDGNKASYNGKVLTCYTAMSTRAIPPCRPVLYRHVDPANVTADPANVTADLAPVP